MGNIKAPMEQTLSKLKRIAESKNFNSVEELNEFFTGMNLDDLDDQIGAEDNDFDQALLRKSQELVYEAWETESTKKRIKLAKQALDISPNCADAYMILADDLANTATEQKSYYKLAITAGESALGEEFFKENKGHFWGMLETRPYMRALMAYADILWDEGSRTQSIEYYQKLLELNPNDNQGVRYIYFDKLLELNDHASIETLMKSYPDEGTSHWLYNVALFRYQKHGDSPEATKALIKAENSNPHVLDFVQMKKKLPSNMYDTYALGSKEEAVNYIYDTVKAWNNTAGAIAWIQAYSPQLKLSPKSTH
jgi:tetratricopeptide (TPR) repeat protein